MKNFCNIIVPARRLERPKVGMANDNNYNYDGIGYLIPKILTEYIKDNKIGQKPGKLIHASFFAS